MSEPELLLDPEALDEAATELIRAAGRPELYLETLNDYERQAWRHIAARVILVYLQRL